MTNLRKSTKKRKFKLVISNNLPKTGKRGQPQSFPRILFKILECKKFDKYIRWTSDGNGVKITNDKDQFVKNVTSNVNVFRQISFSSFQRQLNLYNFEKNGDVYTHPYFKLKNIDFAKIIRIPIKKKLKFDSNATNENSNAIDKNSNATNKKSMQDIAIDANDPLFCNETLNFEDDYSISNIEFNSKFTCNGNNKDPFINPFSNIDFDDITIGSMSVMDFQ